MFSSRFKLSLAGVAVAALLSTQAFAGFLEGKQAYDKGEWMNAIMNLRPLAEAGDARAAVLLGNMYLDGHGVAEDSVEAFGLYRKAAQAHNTDGMVALATLYLTGKGTETNIPVARGWFERAARLGNQTGAFIYAIQLINGSKGLRFDYKPDLAAAYKWFKIASLYGHDKKISGVSGKLAEQIVVKKLITNDEQVTGDRDAVNWKPEMPETFTLTPEEIRLKELWAVLEKERAEQKITDPLPPLDKLPAEVDEKHKKGAVSDKPKGPPPGALSEVPAKMDTPKEDAPKGDAVPQQNAPRQP